MNIRFPKALFEIFGCMADFHHKMTIREGEAELKLGFPSRGMSLAKFRGYVALFKHRVGDGADAAIVRKHLSELPKCHRILFYAGDRIIAFDVDYDPKAPCSRSLRESRVEDEDDLSDCLVCIRKVETARSGSSSHGEEPVAA